MHADHFNADDLPADSRRYSYRFQLHNNEGGGTYRTDERSLDKARDSLLDKYGDRLAVVVRA